jgi:hypothetical protein
VTPGKLAFEADGREMGNFNLICNITKKIKIMIISSKLLSL